jgi:vanillate O-demethylase ferredoxin subunit
MAATNNELWQLGRVVQVAEVATDIRRIVIEPSQPKKAEPGSHIDVRVPVGGEIQKRSYSLVESSEDGGRLVISVYKVPTSRDGSLFMHSLQVGDTLEITQPLQNFPLRVGASRYVLLAGGIGVTAVMEMARVLRNLNADYTFVYVARNRAAMAYRSELQELHGGNLVVHVDEDSGVLDVARLVAEVDSDTELYMCGPIRLMDAVRRAWVERELSLPNLRYETFGNSGWYSPEEFVVRIPRLGVETRVPQGRSMLEALEDAGVDMMFDCRKGECGLCEVRILQLDGTLDHRDVFYSQRQKDSAEKMCCCVSRAVAPQSSTLAATNPTQGPAIMTIEVA